MFKSKMDQIAKNKVRSVIVDALTERGLDAHMTNNIEEKMDDLIQALIDDIGYIKLAKIAAENVK